MKTAYVLMTAMPPTTGHLQLVQFANRIADNGVVVILNTQPFEPFPKERARAMRLAIKHLGEDKIVFKHYSKELPQDPNTPGFWEMWHDLLKDYGIEKGDYIVASERYGQKLAEITGTEFFPYDIGRSINPVKGTKVREQPINHFKDILPEFRPYLRTRITVFGAESTGKTTLSRQLAKNINALWLFEYARPYLEETVNEINVRSMTGIWKGQRALEEQADNLTNSPYIIQDTDLFSTVGYWQFPHWQSRIGEAPKGLINDAIRLKSDLYIITRSNIPFEKDPLRYGGDKREGSDKYWINICKQYSLPYVVLEDSDIEKRLQKARQAVEACAKAKVTKLSYDRHGL